MKSIANASPRLLYADFVRSYSIIAVVVMHVATRIVEAYNTTDRFDWWVANIIDSACRWGVPCFVLLSGALILEPTGIESTRTFFMKRVNRIVIPVVFWFIIYFLWLNIWYHKPIDLKFILKAIIYWGPFYHLYFFYIIISMYFITPLVRRYLLSVGEGIVKSFCGFFLFIGCFSSALFCFKGVVPISVNIPLNVFFLFSLIGYLGYFLAGYILKRTFLEHRAIGYLALVYISAVMVTAAGTYAGMKRFGSGPQGLYLYDYFSLPCFIMALCIFLMTKQWYAAYDSLQQSNKIYQWVSQVFSPATFGIFLVHPIVLDILELFFPIAEVKKSYSVPIAQWTRIPFLTIAVISISLTITIFLKKIPFVKKVVG